MKRSIIFTDLDGTLLDHSTYSFEKALSSLQQLKEKNIPLIFCSSKTRKEIEHYRRKLDNHHPFISENGGGIFIPGDYFSANVIRSFLRPPLPGPGDTTRDREGKGVFTKGIDYHIITLGAHYSDLRRALMELRGEGFDIKGFGDMTIEELSDIAHLNPDEAAMAKERDFDEPFIFRGDVKEAQKLFESINKKGFRHTQGRFFHILGNSDKGRAVALLTDLYTKQFNKIVTVAIGDSLNDLPMLEKVDYPVIVRKADGGYDSRIDVPHLIKADGIGPEGWNKAVMQLTEMLPTHYNKALLRNFP